MLKVEIIFICMNDVCQFNYNVQLIEGTIIPAIMQSCPKCKASFEIQRIEDHHSNEFTEHSKLGNAKNKKEPLTKPPNISTSPTKNLDAGNEIISGFVNRLTPVFILNNIIQQQGRNGPIHLGELKERWLEKSSLLRDTLIRIEQSYGIKRGERLSDGFPVDAGPIHIFFNNVIGTAYSTSYSSKGILERFNFIRWESEDWLIPTETGLNYTLPDLESNIFSAEPKVIQTNPKLLIFLNENQRMKIIDALKEQIPDEFTFLLEILNEISTSNQEYGWDSNYYGIAIARDHFNGIFHSRWKNAHGNFLYHHYQEQHGRIVNRKKKKGKKTEKFEEFVTSRLTNNINSNLGGLLSRMKELNLIYPIRVGRSKNFAITEFGKKILTQNQASVEEEQ